LDILILSVWLVSEWLCYCGLATTFLNDVTLIRCLLTFESTPSHQDAAFWGKSEEATIGWLRQSEIKHSRVAMAAFVGYCVQSNFHWPWAMTMDGTPFPSIELSPPEQWDALPLPSKLQIILFIGFLEWVSRIVCVSFVYGTLLLTFSPLFSIPS
jgi:Chlorophyll A-B binding protein